MPSARSLAKLRALLWMAPWSALMRVQTKAPRMGQLWVICLASMLVEPLGRHSESSLVLLLVPLLGLRLAPTSASVMAPTMVRVLGRQTGMQTAALRAYVLVRTMEIQMARSMVRKLETRLDCSSGLHWAHPSVMTLVCELDYGSAVLSVLM